MKLSGTSTSTLLAAGVSCRRDSFTSSYEVFHVQSQGPVHNTFRVVQLKEFKGVVIQTNFHECTMEFRSFIDWCKVLFQILGALMSSNASFLICKISSCFSRIMRSSHLRISRVGAPKMRNLCSSAMSSACKKADLTSATKTVQSSVATSCNKMFLTRRLSVGATSHHHV